VTRDVEAWGVNKLKWVIVQTSIGRIIIQPNSFELWDPLFVVSAIFDVPIREGRQRSHCFSENKENLREMRETLLSHMDLKRDYDLILEGRCWTSKIPCPVR
jgi:hypothetical protein